MILLQQRDNNLGADNGTGVAQNIMSGDLSKDIVHQICVYYNKEEVWYLIGVNNMGSSSLEVRVYNNNLIQRIIAYCHGC